MAETQRIVLKEIPVKLDPSNMGAFSKSKSEAVAEMLSEYIPIIEQTAKPKAILKWCDVTASEPQTVTIDGVSFESRLLYDKLKEQKKVFLAVITAGNEIKNTKEISDETFKDIFSGSVLRIAMKYVNDYLKENFDMEGISALQPGSLPDWPIANNRLLCEMIGNVDIDAGITLNEAGYMLPWNSFSGIFFADATGYKNCMLCKNYNCVGRRAPFDQKEYDRIFS